MPLRDWKEVFYYDESSPTFLRWACDIPVVNQTGEIAGAFVARVGDVAGSEGHNGKNYKFFQVKFQQKMYKVARIVYELFYGKLDAGMTVDHKDGNPKNNRPSNLRQVTQTINNRNLRKNALNKTGVNGVALAEITDPRYGRTYLYYVAMWRESDKSRRRNFSVQKLGNEEAFRLACEHRAKMVEKLNEQGAGYTERHGRSDVAT